MINFRFHLVSLVAVFLAVGLGILVGSTVVDQKIVNRLDSEIKGVRKENTERKAQSKVLSSQNSQQQAFIALLAPYAGDARLDGESVAIVAERGVSNKVVKQTEASLLEAGADVPGVLWLDDSWKLDSTQQTHALEAALDVHGGAATMRDHAFDLLARRLAKAPLPAGRSSSSSTTTTKPKATSTTDSDSTPRSSTTTPRTTVPPVRIDALAALENAGFLSVDDGNSADFATFPAHSAHVLVITGDDSDFVGTDLTAAFARSLTGANLPTVVGAVYDAGSNQANAPKRGAVLASILDDKVLSKSVSTIDDLDLTQGQVGAVLTLEVVGNENTGHYGYGTGASAPLPPHPS